MGQRSATCRACGCELTGRDVNEGICKDCLEEEVLGGRPKPRKPRPPKPEPPAPAVEEAAPAEADLRIDLDADTKELVAIEAAAPQTSPEPGPEPPPTEDHETAIRFAELGPRRDPLSPEAGGGGEPVTAGVDDEGELPVTEIDIDEEAGATEAVPTPPTAAAPQWVEAKRTVLPAVSGVTAAAPPSGQEPSPVGMAPPEPLRLPSADEQAPPAQKPVATPSDLKIRLDHPAAEASPPSPPDKGLTPVVELKTAPELQARLGRLERRLDDLAARVDALRADEAAGQVRAGFRFLSGMALGLGLLAVVAVGLMALVGKLLYPPALELLERAARALGGG
jgi:hypothetical protein